MEHARRILGSLALLLGLHGAPAALADACTDDYKKKVADCAMVEMSSPEHDPYDTSFWDTCRAKYKQEKESCGGGTAASRVGSGVGGACGKVRENVEWILVRDAGARGSFETARARGSSVFESLIYAQRHNRDAQKTLTDCPTDALAIANALLGGAPAPDNGQTDEATDLACVQFGPATNNYAEVIAKADPKYKLHQWMWTIPVKNTCKKPVRVKFCLRGSQGKVQMRDHTYGAGYTTMNTVDFYEVTDPPGPAPVFLKCRPGTRCELGC